MIRKLKKKPMDLEKEFEQLARRNRSTICSVCYMFSQNEEELANLSQEVLINLWKGYRRFRQDSSEKTWVYRIALNTCISLYRKEKRRAKTRLDLDVNLFSGTDEESPWAETLHRRIQQLKPFDRAILLLWLENISYDEIGAIVGITAQNVGVRLYRIKEQLKNMK